MKQFRAKIIFNKKIALHHHVLAFRTPKGAKKVNPGQFFNVKVGGSYDPLLRRPFGAHKIAGSKIEILYKVVGKATKILSERKPDEMLDVLGPLGNGFDIKSLLSSGSSSVALIAGGHGVAPLYALAKNLKTFGLKISVFIGASSKKYVVCDGDFKKLGLKVHVATEDGSKGHKGLVTDLLKSGCSICACGPKPMLKAVAKLSGKYKTYCQVSMEEYLGCGTGICMGCAIKTCSGNKLVCKDGPVFNAKEIIW